MAAQRPDHGHRGWLSGCGIPGRVPWPPHGQGPRPANRRPGRGGRLAGCPAARLAGRGRHGRPGPLARVRQRAGHPTRSCDRGCGPLSCRPAGQHGGRPDRRRLQQAILSHRGRRGDPLYRIRKLLLTAQEQLTGRGRVRLQAGLATGDPSGEVAAAWQGKELLWAVYRAVGLSAARAALDCFYHWCDGVQVPELSRLARTV
jgi:hypothetical protein